MITTHLLKFDKQIWCYGQQNASLDPDQLKEQNEAISTLVKNFFSSEERENITQSFSSIKITNTTISLTSNDSNATQKTIVRFIRSKEDKALLKIILQGQKHLVVKRDTTSENIYEICQKDFSARLFLYSSGGGGHKSAKNALLEKDLKQFMRSLSFRFENEQATLAMMDDRFQDYAKFLKWCKEMGLVNEADTLHDYLGPVGVKAASNWDEAQKAGNVKKQERLASLQWLSDIIFGPIIFARTLRALISQQPKEIISTQAMATGSILRAINVYNLFWKPKEHADVKLHLYMTDMPTELSGHFFDSIKNLSDRHKNILMLHGPKSEKLEKLSGLSSSQIHQLDVLDLPVNPAFLEAATQPLENEEQIHIKITCQKEGQLLNEILKHQSSDTFKPLVMEGHDQSQILNYQAKATDKKMFIMLGSQPTKEAIKEYVEAYIKLADSNPTENFHLFAFTGQFSKECFYQELCEFIKAKDKWPTNLKVIPLSFQDPAQIVRLELLCDTITRSGGGTIMELLVVEEASKKMEEGKENFSPKKRFIHAQQVEKRSLEESIPLWERGNFLSLKESLEKQDTGSGQMISSRVEAISPATFAEKIAN